MVEQAIVALIKAAATSAGDRVYPLRLPRDPAFPAVVYQRISTVRDVDHGGDQAYANPRVQLTFYARDTAEQAGYPAVKALADEVRQVVNGYRGTIAGVTVGRIQMTGDLDGWDPERSLDRVTVDLLVSFQEEPIPA